MTYAFDAIIIGADQAGPPLADRLTASGMCVVLIERGRFGGTCVNTGCMPTKPWWPALTRLVLLNAGANMALCTRFRRA